MDTLPIRRFARYLVHFAHDIEILDIKSLRSDIGSLVLTDIKILDIMTRDYIKLGDLDVYKMSVEYSGMAWAIYERFEWQIKKIIGDQFIESVDSVGANIAEGYGRYHYKDRIKFYYNSRGSLIESKHWILLLHKRKLISKTEYNKLLKQAEKIHKKLNFYISSCYKNVKK